MVCPYCGNPNPETPFCAYCGRPLPAAPLTPTPPPLKAPASKKSRTGPVIGLGVGCVLLAAAAAVLLIVLLNSSVSVIGWWYSSQDGVAIALLEDGSAQCYTPDGAFEGEYELKGKEGVVEYNDEEYGFTVDEDRILLEAEDDIKLRRGDEDFDVSEYVVSSDTLQGPYDITGDWYEVQYMGVLTFENGSVLLQSWAGADLTGTYEFDPAAGTGSLTLTYEGQQIHADFRIQRFSWDGNEGLFIGDEWYSREYREQYEGNEFIEYATVEYFDFVY